VNQIKNFNRTIVVRQRNRSPAGDKLEKIGVLNFELALIRKGACSFATRICSKVINHDRSKLAHRRPRILVA
jgi:hypothetical protein